MPNAPNTAVPRQRDMTLLHGELCDFCSPSFHSDLSPKEEFDREVGFIL